MRFAGLVGIATLAIACATSSWAEETSENRVSAQTDWSVFVDEAPKECWSVSAPKESVNTRGGNVVTARRGQILLMVFYRPAAGALGQVAFTGGYPFATGSTVEIDIGGRTFELFTEGEWAWPATTNDDASIIAAMKSGAEATATGLSSRGTTTKDRFSLLGFTASVEDAEARCK